MHTCEIDKLDQTLHIFGDHISIYEIWNVINISITTYFNDMILFSFRFKLIQNSLRN